MNKSFKFFSKLVLGASLVVSVILYLTNSASNDQTVASKDLDNDLNLNAPATQPIKTNENTSMNDNPIQNTNFIVLDAPITNNGLYWTQPGGYNYFCLYVENTGNEPIKLHIMEDDIPTLLGSIPAKSSKTWLSPELRLLADSKIFGLSYSTGTGEISGVTKVRVSDAPLW